MRHKHAEVLIAIADGGMAQWRDPYTDNWEEMLQSEGTTFNPISRPNYDWRIKSEPKPDVVRYCVCSIDFGHESATDNANLIITFDGETGKLKSAEVIK